MRKLLGVLSVFGLSSAPLFVAWTVVSSPGGSHLPPRSAKGFDFDYVQPLPPAPPPDMRDAPAPAPAASPLPIPYQGMLKTKSVEQAAPLPRKPAPRALVSVRHETWALGSGVLAALRRSPARFLASSTALHSPRALLAFLENKKQVEAYMDSPLVRVTLNSPPVARQILGSRPLVRAFLSTPAMRNPRAARALVLSPIARKMLVSPGVTQALRDPAVVRNLMSDAQAAEWLEENPVALKALTRAVPGLGSYLASKP